MSRQQFLITSHSQLPTAGDEYCEIKCTGAGGEVLLLSYLRPDIAYLSDDDPWSIGPRANSYDPVAKKGVAYFPASDCAWHESLLTCFKQVKAEVDDACPAGMRIFTDLTLPAPTNDVVPNVVGWLTQHMNVYYALKWNEPSHGGLHYSEWPAQKQQDFVNAFAAAWNHQPMPLTDPPPNQVNYDTDQVVLTEADAWHLFCAHAAYSLAVEIGRWVPWSITEYSTSDLELLLTGGNMFRWDSANNGYGLIVEAVPAPPEFTWAFLSDNGVLGADRVTTIAKLLDWCRNNLKHFFGDEVSATMLAIWGYAGYPPVSRVVQGTVDATLPLYGVQHWTAGCWGTTAFLQAVLRVVNIPVEAVTGGQHFMPHFTTDDLYLSHGDDPYGELSKCTPPFDAKLLLIDSTTFNNWFGPSVPPATAANNVGRQQVELTVQYLSDCLLHRYYLDQQAGLTPQTGKVYTDLLQCDYPNFNDLYPDLWRRMDKKLADFGLPPSEATKLVWHVQPGGARAGGQLAPQPVLYLEDASGDVVTTNNCCPVTVALTKPGWATLGGTAKVTLNAGVATFTDLTVGVAGSYTLTAICGDITSPPSDAFLITTKLHQPTDPNKIHYPKIPWWEWPQFVIAGEITPGEIEQIAAMEPEVREKAFRSIDEAIGKLEKMKSILIGSKEK